MDDNGNGVVKEFAFEFDDSLSWGDYKKITGDETPFAERIALIEKHVRVTEGNMDDAPLGAVLGALRSMMTAAANPTDAQKKV